MRRSFNLNRRMLSPRPPICSHKELVVSKLESQSSVMILHTKIMMDTTVDVQKCSSRRAGLEGFKDAR